MKKVLLFFVSAVFVVASCVFIQSCISEDDVFNDEKRLEYLDIKASKNGVLSEEDLSVLDKAFTRMKEYFIVEEDTCFLTIDSAEEVYMSQSVFALIEQFVANTNLQYEIYLLTKNEDLGFIVKNPFDISNVVVRLKAGYEATYGNQWMRESVSLSHSEVITVINALRAANGSISGFSSLILTWMPGLSPQVVATIMCSYMFLKDSQLSNIQNSYAYSGSTSGMILSAYTVWSSSTGISSTAYSASYR